MARLNEPPPASESIDALKRRFIRQNREIARVNSTQSLRIRNLEAEITRLLGENIEFREQAIKSDQEVQRLRQCREALEDVSILKDRLQSKLRQIDGLVIELGSISQLSRGRPCRRDKHSDREQNLAVEQRKCSLNTQIERELQEGRLPPIVEGKSYPRKTLDGLEIRQAIDNAAVVSESPEIGPPPIAHFDVSEQFEPETTIEPEEDPVKRPGLSENTEDKQGLKSLPDMLEKRRKRRTSSLLEDMPQLTVLEEPKVPEPVSGPRIGEKRKLQVREDPKETPSAAGDDFSFRTRTENTVPNLSRPKGSRFTKRSTAGAATNMSTNASEGAVLSPRKILAPKVVNSPRKPTRQLGQSLAKEESKPVVTKAERGEGVLRSRRTASTSTRPTQTPTPSIAPDPESQAPPETPRELELFSPPSTEHSGRTSQVKEIAISASVEDVLGGNDGRTSRRARGAVSYAEPSLRAKMRRPTKELVAAVGESTNSFRQPSREPGARAESHERSVSREVKAQPVAIKLENQDDSAWHDPTNAHQDPASPLVSKVARVTQSQSPPDQLPSPRQVETRELEKSLSSLSILDGPDASPQEADAPSSQARRLSRRHSSNPTSLKHPIQDLSSTAQQKASTRPARPHSAAGTHRDDKPGGGGGGGGLRRSTSAAVLKSPQSSASEASSSSGSLAASAQTFGRSERAAARRRSMMV